MIELYFDGACEPINPGGTASYGWLIKKDGKTLRVGSGIVGKGHGMTNNVAEYHGLIEGIKAFLTLRIKEKLVLKGDSNLVINMVSKKWGWAKKKTQWKPHAKMPHLKKLLEEIHQLLENLDYDVQWIPREQNHEADELSKNPMKNQPLT